VKLDLAIMGHTPETAIELLHQSNPVASQKSRYPILLLRWLCPKLRQTSTQVQFRMPLALRYMRLPIALSMIAFLLCGPAAAEVVATKSYSYFNIKGKTADELDDELSRRGPTANGSSARHPGATKIRFGGEATYIQENGRCRVGNVKVTVHTQIIMPRWANRKGASRELSMIWDALSSDIRRHEERHAEIARTQARAMERELKALPWQRNCEAMQELVSEKSARGIEEHDKLQARFDRVEAVNFQNRMLRLLNNRLKGKGGER
jgi:predicted secreted Zn-dependent protease